MKLCRRQHGLRFVGLAASRHNLSRSSGTAPRVNMAGGNMNLSDYNSVWKTFLESDKCPPVLGLAPLSKEEADEIRVLVQAQLPIQPNQRFNRLISLLKLHPAVMTVWLT